MLLYCLDKSQQIASAQGSATQLVVNLSHQKYRLYGSSTSIPISRVEEFKDNNPKRKFVVLDFANIHLADVQQTLKTIFHNPLHVIYKLNKDQDRLVMDLAQSFTRKSYHKVVENLYIQFNLPITKSRTDLVRPIIFQPFDVQKDIIQICKRKPCDIVLENTDSSQDQLVPNHEKLLRATKEFLDTDKAQKIIHDRTEVTHFFDALAKVYILGQISNDYLTSTLKYMSQITHYDYINWRELMDERIKLLRENPEMREIAPPFGAYIHLYSQAHKGTNIAGQLKASLPPGTQENPDYELADAANFIEMSYPPYLLDQPGEDVDNMVVFNAASGIWTHDPKILYSLLTAIRPYTSETQFNTFMMTFGAKARNANRFIRAYSGSRYLLFNNCVLDVATMKQYELSDPIVRDLHFTERSHIDLEYTENPVLPELPGKRQYDNGPWNPRDFLMAYADNNSDAYTYLLFGLALGLFGGHNFGVHFDIQGGSRWGKSTLQIIFERLYDNRTVKISFPDLNGRFPFTSYPLDTSIIWLDECNEGVDPLDDNHGTIIYDTLADNQARFQVKNKGDIVLPNPPQVYITGTQFIKARELYTGPAGRTLAFKLPQMTEQLRHQSYSNAITECLRNKKVLQWLVYHMIMAYKEIVPVQKMDDLNINLDDKNVLNLFPDIAKSWRKEFVVGGSTIDDWFADTIEPYLSHDPNKPTYLHERVLYAIYLSSYRLANPNDPYAHQAKTATQLMKRLKTIWASQDDKYGVNYQVGSLEKGRKTPRKMVKDPDYMNFDWTNFDQDFARPKELESPGYENLKLFNKKSPNWLEIYLKTPIKKTSTKNNKQQKEVK